MTWSTTYTSRKSFEYALIPRDTYRLFARGDAISDGGWPRVTTAEVSICITPKFVVEPRNVSVDGIVDGADLAMIVGSWSACTDCPEDVNQDGEVNGADLAYVLGYWTF